MHRWLPEGARPRAVVQIAHGLAEHAGRYGRLATRLNAGGWAVYGNDHRGHGRTGEVAGVMGAFAETDGWARVLADCRAVNAHVRAAHPGAPVVLLGHSMGSFLTQLYVGRHGDTIAAAVLSGSSCGPAAPELAALARAERARLGWQAPSDALAAASFGTFNAPFAPARTDFDWLSRDPAEVDAYVADPRCGFAVSASLWLDLVTGLDATADPAEVARVPRDLPVYVVSGAHDPVHEGMRGLDRLLDGYRQAGLRDVTTRIYAGGRHEMLNETNRDEVTDDLVRWLEAHVPPA